MSRNNLNRKLKYSIRKKKNGGGAASFIVGSVVLGGLMLGGATTVSANEVTQTGTTGTGSQTGTSAKPSGSTDISDKEVALSSPSNDKPAAPSNGKPAAPSNGKPAAPTAAATESTADATTSAKNKTQPTTSATSESTPEATTTPATTAGDATSESNADTSATTNGGNNAATAQPTAAEVVKKVSAMSPSQLATNKISISNVRLNKSVVKESEGLDINISFDWTGKGLVKGDSFVTDMTNGFTSITRQVEVPFGANGKQLGVMVLDYDQHKIFTTFTADMDPNKIYNGTINIGTFVDRDYFKNEVNEVSHEIKTADGKTVTVPLEVVFDVLRENPKLGNVSVYGKKTIDNSDGSSNITWATVINKVKDEMNDATVYISPDKITGVEPKFRLEDNLKTEWDTLGIKYDKNQAYVINPDTIEVYEADVFDSMGYSKGKQLVKGTDYKVDQSELNPHAYVINFIGDYASTNKQFVIEYGGNVPNTHEDRANINATTTDSLVAYYTGKRVKRVYSFDPDYAGPINIVWNAADINFNNSSITGVTSEDITGSVTVVHIDASTGKTLKAEDYVVDSQGQPLHDVEQGTPYTTKSENFEGYRFTTMGYNSAPATGEVKQGLQRVIYLYVPTEVKKGSVDVTYVAEDGKVLEPTKYVVKDGKVESTYETTEKTFDGYKFKRMGEFSASPTGTVEEGTKHVVYVYAKTGNVDVKYVDTEGNVLPGGEVTPVKTNEEVGTEYGTTQKTFDGYHFVKMDVKSAPATGVVTAKDQHVIYVYEKDSETPKPEEKKGNVDVTYVAEDGKVLEPTKYVVKDGKVESTYETTEKTFDGYKFKRMGEFSASPTGTVEEGTKHVVYVYAKTGNVDVKYVDTEGNVLPGGEVTPVKTNEEVGTEYGTTQKTFDGYHFVKMDVKSAPATGVVTAKDQHVIYVYEKDSETPKPEEKKGNVDVTYVAEDGKVLEPTKYVVKDGKVESTYETTEKTFDGYKFKRMGEFSASPTGTVEEGTKHVVYVYAKTGNVDVKYVDTEGNVLPGGEVTPVKTNEEVGTEYGTTQKTFDGYHFVKMDVKSAPATGVVTAKDQHVIYVYEKDSETPKPEEKKGNVDVTYVAEDGKVLEPTKYVVKDGKVESTYETTEKTFDGYKFKRMGEFSASPTGTVEEGTKHVVYVYAKTGNVDVKYVDTEGNVLPGGEVTPVKTNEEVGTEYGTTQKTFDGYHFVKMDVKSAPATGVVTAKDQHVIYVYEKDSETPKPEEKKGNVDVTYVAEDGKVLEPTKYVVKDGKVESTYETTEKTFDGYKFKRMGEFSASPTGTVEEGTKHVVYVYAKTGNVDVKYVDTEGNVLPGGEVTPVKTNEEVGTEYGTTQKTFDGYHFVKMDVKSAPATGVVTAKDQHVIYVYEKDSETPKPEEKKGNVDVTYVAEDGKVLEPTKYVVKDGKVESTYETTEKTFDGYKFKRMGEFSASPTGTVEEGTKHVVYVYAKTGNVDVKYVDTEGNVLPGGEVTPVKTNEEVGTEYGTTQKTFDGYHFVKMDVKSAPATGVVTAKDQHVIYVYEKDSETPKPEEKKGNVDVTYVAEDGKVLEPTKYVVKDGKVESTYETTEKTFDGYKFKRMGEFSASPTGTVEEGTKHVVYVYAKTGNVDVKYVDTEGNVLPGGEVTPVKTNEEVGTEYGTTQKTFDGYHFVKMDVKSAPATGVVTAKDQHVIYVYEKDSETPKPEEKKGNVDVTYVAEDGKVLEPTKYVVKDGEVGSNYETKEKPFGGYHFVRMGEFSADATGQVEEGTKHVVYIYAKNPETPEVKKGSVDVKYVTTDGKVLEDVTKVKDNAPVGEAYTTEEKSFDGYHFVGMDKTSDSANGKVTEGDKHVIYVYEKDVTPEVKKGSVDVKYVTTDGKVLEDVTKVKDSAPVGEAYTTEEKSFDGYHFVGMDKTSDSANGKVTEGDKHVVYVYEKDETPEVKKGSVDVKYVTTDGKVLEDVTKVKDNAPVGEAYTTEEKSFDGYHFVGMDKTSDSANGKVTEGDKHVVYVYEKDETPEVKKGSVDVKYVTTDGKVLEDVTKVKDNAPVGEAYTTEEKSFDGYHFVGMDKTSDSANGKVTEGDKHIVYVYEKDPEVPTTPVEKKGSVYVKYVDENGNELPGGEKTTVVKDGKVGSYYFTTEKDFDGYTFSHMAEGSSDPTGKVVEGDQQVVYVYEKDETPEVKKGSVDVKYVTTDGKVLEDVTKVKDNVPVGEAYTTEEKSFDGYHFVGMDKTSDSANGKVTEGDKHIVYVYEKDPEVPTTPVEKKGSVYVKYVDENGNELPGGEKTTVVKDGNVGSYYFTTEKDFDGYTFSHMAEGSSNPTGKVVEGDQQVVYVYTKNNTPQPEPNKPEVPTTPETPAVPQEEKTTTDTPVKTSTSKVNAEKVTVNKATVLPQTGDKKENNSSVMGLVSLGLAGLLGLGIKRKEEKDNH